MQCLRGGRDVRQTVIDQGEIVVNQREVRLNLRRRFVMQARQRKVACVVVEVSEVVVRLDVTRIVFQRLGEVVETRSASRRGALQPRKPLLRRRRLSAGALALRSGGAN